MLFVAAVISLSSPAAPTVVTVAPQPKSCATQIIHTKFATGKFDPKAPMEGGLERRADSGQPFLMSTVERTIDGCAFPVIRARADTALPPPQIVKPVEN